MRVKARISDLVLLRLYCSRIGSGDLIWQIPLGFRGLVERLVPDELGAGYSVGRVVSDQFQFSLPIGLVKFAQDWRELSREAVSGDRVNLENLLLEASQWGPDMELNPIRASEMDWMQGALGCGPEANWCKGIPIKG